MAVQTTSFKNASGLTVTPISGSNSSDNNPKQGYEQTLTQLQFSDGLSTMVNGKNGNLQLPPDEPIINLLVSQPSILFPVLATSVGPDYSASGGWPKPLTPVDISDSQAEAMKQALTFRQNILSAPSSKMANDFQAALQLSQKAKTVDDMMSTMNDFFASQPSYSNVTYDDYSAVQSYLQAFAQMWVQRNTASKDDATGATYYIYSAPQAGKKGATSKGTIQANRNSDAPANASLTDPMSGYSFKLTSDSSPIELTFANGSFSDGGPVQLAATYGYAGRFNGKTSGVQLWPILVGTIQSQQVIAIPLAPESGWDKFWSELSFQKLFNYFMEGMGLWMALDFLKTKLSSKKESLEKDKAENKGEDPTDSQVEQADTDADAAGSSEAEANSARGREISGDENFDVPTTESEIDGAITDTRTSSQDAQNNIAEDNANGAIEETGNTLEEIAKIDTTPALEKAGSDLNDAGEAMQADPPDIPAANEHIQSSNEHLATATEELGNQISQEQKEVINDQIEANKEAAEEAEEQDKDADDAGEGEDPEGAGDFPEIPEV